MTDFGQNSEGTMLGPLSALKMEPNWVGLGD
jgi:hypothetical protein